MSDVSINLQIVFSVVVLIVVGLFGLRRHRAAPDAARGSSFLRGGPFDGYFASKPTDFEPMTAAESSGAAAGAATPLQDAGLSNMPEDGAATVDLGHSMAVPPADLLPRNVNKTWLKDSKVGSLAMPNIATPDFRFGANTIGQSLKNPNLQERPDPVIPRGTDTGPFNQSVIDPDRPFKSQLAIR